MGEFGTFSNLARWHLENPEGWEKLGQGRKDIKER
jgi:hypothetical protein